MEGEASEQLQCDRELQELQERELKACQQVMDQQLRDISPECHPVVVSPVAGQYEQQIVVPPKGGTFYPGETTPPQQLQQRIFWGIPALLKRYYPSVTCPQQVSYYPGQASPQRSRDITSSSYHVSVEHQAASLKVAKAQQLAAQLPAMCRLEGGDALSASQ
uniref:High-molecular-weight glutenin n=1 Tax=Triticum aestivum TaxID=4565 RepID=Q7M1M7_WHEAT